MFISTCFFAVNNCHQNLKPNYLAIICCLKDLTYNLQVRPKPGEDTVLLDQTQMKHASLPMGAVEIGTIAEAETDDEEDEEVIEGKETKYFQERK